MKKDKDQAVAKAIKKSLEKGRRVEIDGKKVDRTDWDYDKANPERREGNKPFGTTTVKKLKLMKSVRQGKLVYEMKKFSDKLKKDKSSPKEEPEKKDPKEKVDTRGKNDVQPDDDKKKQQKPEEKDKAGFSLDDDSKKTDNDKQVADDGDKKDAEKGKTDGGKPDVDVKEIDGKKKPGKAGGGKTKVDLDPELDPVPPDQLVGESRASKVLRIAREYRGRAKFESIE